MVDRFETPSPGNAQNGTVIAAGAVPPLTFSSGSLGEVGNSNW